MILLIPLSTSAYWQLLDDRYLAPLVIPINILFINFTYELLNLIKSKNKLLKKGLIFICLSMLLITPAKRMIYAVIWQYEAGIGYTANIWRDSETIRYLKNNALSCHIYSNSPDVIYFYNNMNVDGTPNSTLGAPEFGDIETDLNNWNEKKNKCIVWFDNIDRNYLYPINELLTDSKIKSIISLTDGNIYILD